jgi:hypothetical protein
MERDKEFVGLFTPSFLPALQDGSDRQLERTSSAPSVVESLSKNPPDAVCMPSGFERSNSDTAAQAKPKRPSQLVLAHRTSSSGSSADGKLASAMKSPTPVPKPKRKRVSLAVGDSIVAPSDSVPSNLNIISLPSHSRQHPVESSKLQQSPPVESPIQNGNVIPNGVSAKSSKQLVGEANKFQQDNTQRSAPLPAQIQSANSTSAHDQFERDADVDMFGLDEDTETPGAPVSYDEDENAIESEDEIIGRIRRDKLGYENMRDANKIIYDSEAGLIPELESDRPADGLDFEIGLAPAGPKRELNGPGFSQPSVLRDPIYIGNNYHRAELAAVNDEIYGSSYNRPSSKGSFTSGSLGESFMEQNAEAMMRLRNSRRESRSRS